MPQPTTPAVAHAVTVSGYKPGSHFREVWIAVFDTSGNLVEGSSGESQSAVQIRYLELYAIPHTWQYHGDVLEYEGLDRLLRIHAAAHRLRLMNAILPPKCYRGRIPVSHVNPSTTRT